MSGWLAVVQPRLAEPLFRSSAVERLVSVTGQLPWNGLAILETRLASGDGPVDLSIRLSGAAQARFLSEARGSFPPVRSVWLEFDLDRGTGGLPEPILCAKLFADADPAWVVDALLPDLHGRALARGQRDRWLSCQREIPPSGRLLYAFSLRTRGSDAVRMEIFGLNTEQILDFLGRIAPAAVAPTAEITPLFEEVERLHLSFDLSPEGEVLPRIGVEGSFPRFPWREPRWRELFARLEERELCHPGKREAALAWPGYDSFWTAPERWPVGAQGFCIRTLSHVKVVCAPDREPEAKVYLAIRTLPEREEESDLRPGARPWRDISGPEAR